IVPFPGAPPVPDVPGAEIEPAPEVIEAELVDEQDDTRRTALQRYVPPLVVVHRVVVVVRPRTATAGKATLRAGVSIAHGFGSWAHRGYDAATFGVYRDEIQAARAVGDHEQVADWTTRHLQAKAQRHQRLLDAPKLVVGGVIVAGGVLLGSVLLVLLVAVLVAASGAGEFLGVLSGVRDGLRWCLLAVPWVLGAMVLIGPPLLLRTAHREGLRTGTAPRWLLNPEQRAEHDAVITPDVLATALQHVKIPALTKYLAGGGRLEFVIAPREQGGGTYTQIRLPIGVMAAELLPSVKVELHIADLKGDWSMFRPRAVTLIEGSANEDAEATAEMLEWGVAEMRRRYEAKSAAGIVGNITREISRQPGSGFHPVWLIVDECQVLYGAPHPIGGAKDEARAWRAAKRLHDQARAVNVHLVQATQRPDDRTLPVRVREGAHVRAALNVPNYETARMVLADAADRGARPQDLRPGADAGTVVATGEVEDIPKGQAFAIVRTHYVSTADAYPVIERALAILHRAGRTVAHEPEPAEIDDVVGVDHLADIAEQLRGERRERTQVVLGRLMEHNPGEYGDWDLPRLTAVLDDHHAAPVKSGGRMFVDADLVAQAITERDR
ncbi:MAG: hypothetical protein ABR608_14990, partial [Pseudonocardiaceae bacterium]